MGTKECGHITASSSPAKGEAGRTGDWRVKHPVINHEVCTPSKTGRPSCFLCWTYCPDGVVSKTVPPQIDLEYCKGCGICAEECPTGAIEMVTDE
ncbi:MAG: pyruvate ferredoxin oxidoreductase [bacterium]|nr:pyruvate ferredoxin oxidoreductase [bacterium]